MNWTSFAIGYVGGSATVAFWTWRAARQIHAIQTETRRIVDREIEAHRRTGCTHDDERSRE